MIDGDRNSAIVLWTVKSISHYYDNIDDGEPEERHDPAPDDINDEPDIQVKHRAEANKKKDYPKWDFDEAGDIF